MSAAKSTPKTQHNKGKTAATAEPVDAVKENIGGDEPELEDRDVVDTQEKCELCGRVDNGTNSDESMGCDGCTHWYCIDLAQISNSQLART